jgi:hypothetical protein
VTTSRFAEEFRIWVISTAECQKERVQPDVPALTSYLTRRSLNVGFYPYIVLLEYVFDENRLSMIACKACTKITLDMPMM